VQATSVTFGYSAPQYVDSNDVASQLTIQKYIVSYSTIGSAIRYPNPIAQSTVKINNTTSLSYTPSDLYPDSPYIFSVYASNSAGIPGNPSTISGTTSYLSPTSQLSLITFPSRYYTNGTIKNILSNTTKTNLVNSTTDWTSVTFTTPIQNIATRGSTTLSLMSISTFSVNNGSRTTGPSLSFGGFPAGVASANTLNNITLSSISIADNYASQSQGQQGFYLNSSNNLTIKSAFLTAAPSKYDYTISVSTISSAITTGSASFTFQVDTLIATAPTVSINSFTFASLTTAASNMVSGISIIYGTPSFYLVTSATNMGQYYCSFPLLTYSGTYSWTPTSETTFNNITLGSNNGVFANTIYFSTTVTSATLSAAYTNTIPINVVAYNQNTNSTTATTSISVLIDGPSYALVYTTLPQSLPTISASSETTGFRITSATAGSANVPPLTNGGTPYANTGYDNTASIISLQELQVSNGRFTTPGQTYSYINYSGLLNNSLNYSGIATSGYRYASFAWRMAANGTNQYTNLQFNVYGTSGISIVNNLAVDSSSTPIQYYYRIEDAITLTPASGYYYTTAWINGNSLADPVTTGNLHTPSDYNNSQRGGLQNTAVNTSGKITFPVFIPPLNISTQTVNLYCRIGLPMNLNPYFTYITAVIS